MKYRHDHPIVHFYSFCLLQKYVNFVSVINVIIFIIYVKTGA